MHRREKAVQNKDKAIRLKKAWGVRADQARYSDDGHWYGTLIRFPAALFDATGYIYFATEEEYHAAPMSIGKQISVQKPGISTMPGYVRMIDSVASENLDSPAVRFANKSDIEGIKTEVLCFKRLRSRRLRDLAFKQACGICCVCDRDFSKLLGGLGVRVLQVHHREQLSTRDAPSVTKVADLAVVCANCHMLLHLEPEEPLRIEDLRGMMVQKEDLVARDDLRAEYDPSELKGGVRGKHLDRYRAGTNLALLAPDVRAAFPTDEAVNQALRSLIQDQPSS